MSIKNKVYGVILIISIAIAVGVYVKSNFSGNLDSSAFAVADTAKITKIFLVNRNNARVVLKKRGDGLWSLNDSFIARPNKVEILLDAIRRMEIKSPTPKSMNDYVVKELSSKGIKVEIFAGDKKIKSFLVGTDTQDLLGTFMLLDESKSPQIVHLPGFNGFLSVRFASRLQDWRDYAIFRYEPSQVDQIKVEYMGDLQNSFTLRIVSENIAQLTSLKGDTARDNINPDFFRKFVTNFRMIGYLELLDPNRTNAINTDSLLQTTPFATVTVLDKTGNIKKASFYLEPKPVRLYRFQKNAYTPNGQPIINLDEQFITALPGTKDYAYTQRYALEKVLVKYTDFFNKN